MKIKRDILGKRYGKRQNAPSTLARSWKILEISNCLENFCSVSFNFGIYYIAFLQGLKYLAYYFFQLAIPALRGQLQAITGPAKLLTRRSAFVFSKADYAEVGREL